MSVAISQDLAASPETPGSKNFPPFSTSPELNAEAEERISHYSESKRSAVLPLLHIVQHRFGFISPESIEWVAKKLELEPIKVLEVVTFYPGFRQYAPGKYHIRVCRTLSCALGGSGELMDDLCKEFGIDRTSADPHHHPISVSPCGTTPFHPSQIPPTAPPSAPPQKQIPSSTTNRSACCTRRDSSR